MPTANLLFEPLPPGGRHLILGFAAGNIANLPLNLPLLKAADLRGIFWSRFRKEQPTMNRKNFAILFNAFVQKQLKPCPTQPYPLSNYKTALMQLKNRNTIGKHALIIEK